MPCCLYDEATETEYYAASVFVPKALHFAVRSHVTVSYGTTR
jgi:aspartokinase